MSPSATARSARVITIGHTPDMDDAFMFYALAQGKVAIDGVTIEQVIEDIQTLNQRAQTAQLDVTAISAASYPALAKQYWILSVGSSVGQNYGPLVVSTQSYSPEDLKGRRIAVPGLGTTACLLLKLAISDVDVIEMRYEHIPEAVLSGRVEAALLIHERQITYHDQGLLPILDLGMWWQQQVGLPIPLGLNVVKKSLGKPLASRLAQGLRDSILFAMSHQDDAMAWSLQYGRGIDLTRARQFVSMYVNEETISLSTDSRKALRELYHRAAEREFISAVPRLNFIQPPKP